jgi:PAS domain S-box-containing protein
MHQTKKNNMNMPPDVAAMRLTQFALDHVSMSVAMMRVDDGRIIYVNEAACRNLGFSREELLGMSVFDVDPEFSPARWVELNQRLKNGSVDPFETTHRSKDGRTFTVEVSANVLEIDGVEYHIGFAKDVTERKRAEEQICRANELLEAHIKERTAQLEHAKDEAERANQAKSVFLARMSHELRTPMNAILGFSQVLEIEPLSTEQQSFVHEIHQAGDHLLELINDLLDISRIESGRMEFKIDPVELRPIIEQATQIIRPLLHKMNLTFINRCAHDIMLLADATRLKQILVNLFSNAAKYNLAGGRILIECHPTGTDRLRVTVSDTGTGISQENLARLFTPFERLGMSGNTTIEGTGIGLALSKKMAHYMNGDIGVESTLGQGSTFWIELPLYSLADEMIAPIQAQIESPEQFTEKARVLYVEDNIPNLKVVEAMLRHHTNLTLLSATNGANGLELAQRYLPDIILLDIHLPDMDGYAVLQALQSKPETRGIPVIAVSADAMPLNVERGLNAGFCRYLTKPIQLSELIETINQFLVPNNS